MILHFEVFFTPGDYDLEGRLCGLLQHDGPREALESHVLDVLETLAAEFTPPGSRLGVDLCVADPGSDHPPPWWGKGRDVRAVLLTGDLDRDGARYARGALGWLADALEQVYKKANGRKVTKLAMDEHGVVTATIENPEDNPDEVEIVDRSRGWQIARGFARERWDDD